MLAFEPKEPGIMSRSPRDPDEPILTQKVVERIGLANPVGVHLMLIGAFSLLEHACTRERQASDAEACTVAVNVFVMVETRSSTANRQ